MGSSKIVKLITAPISYCLLALILFTTKFKTIVAKLGSLYAAISCWIVDPAILDQAVEVHNKIAVVLIGQTGGYWENTARSIVAQAYPNIEIIVLNNTEDDQWLREYRDYMTRFGSGESVRSLTCPAGRPPIEVFEDVVNSLEESTIVVPLFIGDWIVERKYLDKLDRIFTYYSPPYITSGKLVYLPQHKNHIAEENVLKNEEMQNSLALFPHLGLQTRSKLFTVSKLTGGGGEELLFVQEP